MKRTLWPGLLLLLASPALAANRVVCWQIAPLIPCVRMVIGDTEAGLPSGTTEGVHAYAKDTDRLVCWSGAAWEPCNSDSGGGVSDGDKGDIIVGSSGTVWTIDTAAVSADELDEAGVEAALEAVLDLADLQGAITDGQVPNNITVDLATTATTANAGDTATAFFPSGTLEDALIDGSAEADEVNPTLGTQTQGDFVASATANQGLLLTGTEGASLGLIDCDAGEVLVRNVGDTAWECGSAGGGGGLSHQQIMTRLAIGGAY